MSFILSPHDHDIGYSRTGVLVAIDNLDVAQGVHGFQCIINRC